MTAKELLVKIKAVFDTPAAPLPVAPADTSTPGTVYTLQDGSQISILQAGDLPAVGDMVSVAGVPAPAGVLTLQDGSMITCDATGAITAYTPVGGPVTTAVPAASAAPPPAAAPAAVPATAPAKAATPVTPAQMADMLTRFATGTPEERLTNLELVAKALMQSEFGWQILEQQRLSDTNAAIAIYNNTLKVAAAKVDSQEVIIKKQEEQLKGLFELVEKIVELPTADPVTLTGNKKEKFEKAKAKEDKFEAIALALKEIREAKKH